MLKYFVVSFLLLGSVHVMAQDKNHDELGRELAAQISGEAAGIYTYLMEECAKIAGDISEERMQEVRAGLSADRENLTGAEDIFDHHFEIGLQRARDGDVPAPTEESCAKAISILRSSQPISPPR